MAQHQIHLPWSQSMRSSMIYLGPLVLLAATLPTLAAAGEAVELASGPAPHHPQRPQVAVDHAGLIHVVYGVGDTIFYRRSEDRGATFSKAVALPRVNAMSLGMRRGPRIAATASGVC